MNLHYKNTADIYHVIETAWKLHTTIMQQQSVGGLSLSGSMPPSRLWVMGGPEAELMKFCEGEISAKAHTQQNNFLTVFILFLCICLWRNESYILIIIVVVTIITSYYYSKGRKWERRKNCKFYNIENREGMVLTGVRQSDLSTERYWEMM